MPNPSSATSSAPAAAVEVLSQRLLMSLIASFQRGPPGVVTPLLQRLTVDGHLQARFRRALWEKERYDIHTPLYTNIRPQRAWAECVTPEAIARYDMKGFHVLRTVLDASAFASKPVRAARRLLHRTTEAAAACGRVDMLQWLYYKHIVFTVQPLLVSFCAKLAVRHGQVAVLEWLETMFSSAALESLRCYDLRDVVKNGHMSTIQWLLARKLGVMGMSAAFAAVLRRDVAMLRVVLTSPASWPSSSYALKQFRGRDGVDLAMLAAQLNQPEAVRCIIELGWVFSIKVLRTLSDIETVKCVLDHLQNARVHYDWGYPQAADWFIQQIIREDNVRVLELIAHAKRALVLAKLGPTVLLQAHGATTSNTAMELLIRMSPINDICTVLMNDAMRGDLASTANLLALVDRPLPSDVVGFVHRIMSDALGPVASLAWTYRSYTDGSWNPDNHLLETIAHRLPSASRQDARDVLLILVNVEAFSKHPFERILAADLDRADDSAPHYDRAFLGMCRTLRRYTYRQDHEGIGSALDQRKLDARYGRQRS